MATAKRATKARTRPEGTITTGTGFKPPRIYRGYPFDKLKKKGDYFNISGFNAEKSIRVQASKQSRKRGVVYRVSKTEKGIVVSHDGNIP